MPDLDIRTHEPEAKRAGKRRDDSRLTTSPDINEHAVENDRRDRCNKWLMPAHEQMEAPTFHKTVDSSIQRDISDSQRGKQRGGVVVDRCSAGHIL